MPILKALIAALAFGLSAPLAKLLLAVVPPLFLAGLLYLGAGVFLGLTRLVWRRRSTAGRPLTLRDRWILAAVVLVGGVLAPPLLLWGLARSPATTTALLLNLEVVFTALLAGLVFGEHLGPRVVIAAAVMALGGIALGWTSGGPEITAAAGAVAPRPPRRGGPDGRGDVAPGARAPLAPAQARTECAQPPAHPRCASPARARRMGGARASRPSALDGPARARASAYPRHPPRSRPPLRRYTRGARRESTHASRSLPPRHSPGPVRHSSGAGIRRRRPRGGGARLPHGMDGRGLGLRRAHPHGDDREPHRTAAGRLRGRPGPDAHAGRPRPERVVARGLA